MGRCSSRRRKRPVLLREELARQAASQYPLQATHAWPVDFVRGLLSKKQWSGKFGPKPKPSTICPAKDLFDDGDHEQRLYVPGFVVEGLLVTEPFTGESLPEVCLQSPAILVWHGSHSPSSRPPRALPAPSARRPRNPPRAVHASSPRPPRALLSSSTRPPRVLHAPSPGSPRTLLAPSTHPPHALHAASSRPPRALPAPSKRSPRALLAPSPRSPRTLPATS